MSRKNMKVATTEDGKTTLTKIDKTPTGKVKTLKDKEKLKKEREEQYKNFRVGSLKRRASRMGLTEKETEAKVKELLAQLDTPNSYTVLILFSAKEEDLVIQALKNEGLVWKMKSNSHLFMDADQETLDTIRKIMPPSAKIHPYAKKKPSVLKDVKPKKDKKPTNNKKEAPKFKAKRWKKPNVAGMKKKERKEFNKKVKALRASWKAIARKKATTVHMKSKKRSKSLKKASMELKQAA